MFDRRAFRTWPHIVLGGLSFGALFTLVMLMAEAVFSGELRLSRQALLFGGAAFFGYLGVAWLVRDG